MTDEQRALFNDSEELFNWTYPGATLYYKDCELKESVIQKFTIGKILRNGYFLDVSWKGGGMKFNVRFLIASSKAAKLYEINKDNEKYGHCCINANSYFKVLDIYKIGDKTQIFLLHIPSKGLNFFNQVTSNTDEDFIKKARESFENKIDAAPIEELSEAFWIKRTNFPVGMDAYNEFYPLSKISSIPKEAEHLYNGIRNLTKDNTAINIPEPNFEIQNKTSENNSFWSKIFKKK